MSSLCTGKTVLSSSLPSSAHLVSVQGSHQATKKKIPWHFLDIPGRFLKIPDGASCVYHFSDRLHLPYIDPLQSPFNASISSFRHIPYLQLLYLGKCQFFLFSHCFIVSYKCKSCFISKSARKRHATSTAKKFHDKQQNSLIFPDISRKWQPWSQNVSWLTNSSSYLENILSSWSTTFSELAQST